MSFAHLGHPLHWKQALLTAMSRNLYILAAVLLALAAICFIMSLTPGSHQVAMPGIAQMWRMMALILFLLGSLSCCAGTVTNLYEQASRRHDERERQRNKSGGPPA